MPLVLNRIGLFLCTCLVAVSCALPSCASQTDKGENAAVKVTVPPPTVAETKPRDYPGIHNAVAFHEGYISGSMPEGDDGFDTLAAMGVRTIISVDGAEPDVARGTARGMRYVHLPIGYNGFDDERKLQLVRATRDGMEEGAVYIHCHHGKHRSAGAAATVATCLGWTTPEVGVERMKVSGTAPTYKGLYARAAEATVLGAAVIDRVPADFPSVSKPGGFVKAMVEIDEIVEHLKAIEKAGWTTPADHPDLVPVAEAGRLADLFRVVAAGERAQSKPDDFREMLLVNEAEASRIEKLLEVADKDTVKLSEEFKTLNATCKACHVKYRD